MIDVPSEAGDAEDHDDVLAEVALRDLAHDAASNGRAMRQTRPLDFGWRGSATATSHPRCVS